MTSRVASGFLRLFPIQWNWLKSSPQGMITQGFTEFRGQLLAELRPAVKRRWSVLKQGDAPESAVHHRNCRERQEPMGLTGGGRIAGNGLVNGFADFGEDVGVQQRFIHQGTAAMAALP